MSEGFNPLAETYLSAAWTRLAPNRAKDMPFPRGFWPDVARVAVEMALAESTEITLTWNPTTCTSGSGLEPREPRAPRGKCKASAGKISAAQRAENTAKLLAAMQMKGTS